MQPRRGRGMENRPKLFFHYTQIMKFETEIDILSQEKVNKVGYLMIPNLRTKFHNF